MKAASFLLIFVSSRAVGQVTPAGQTCGCLPCKQISVEPYMGSYELVEDAGLGRCGSSCLYRKQSNGLMYCMCEPGDIEIEICSPGSFGGSFGGSSLGVTGNCSDVYQKDSNNCNRGCGSCFNPGGRSSTADVTVVKCPDPSQNPGYYCNPEGGVFACMDWTFGSNKMGRQEAAFRARTGEDVWFGVGTFGTKDDPMQGLGNCYRLVVKETDCGNRMAGRDLEKQIIVQSVNTGSDVANIQFDMQIGDGGTGVFNNCAGKGWSMFPGPFSKSVWGNQYGGVDYRDRSQGSPSCDDLPPLPQEPGPMKAAEESLVELCKRSFDAGVRGANGTGGQNPTIVDMARVDCPAELVEMTQLKRSDEPGTFKIEETNRPPPYQSGNAGSLGPCHCSCGGQDCRYCLTRMMDCRKPSGGFKDNIHANLVEDGLKVVQPCTQDGYTRVDVKCGCNDCYC